MLMKNYLILRAADDAFPLWNKGSLPPMLGGLVSKYLLSSNGEIVATSEAYNSKAWPWAGSAR